MTGVSVGCVPLQGAHFRLVFPARRLRSGVSRQQQVCNCTLAWADIASPRHLEALCDLTVTNPQIFEAVFEMLLLRVAEFVKTELSFSQRLAGCWARTLLNTEEQITHGTPEMPPRRGKF